MNKIINIQIINSKTNFTYNKLSSNPYGQAALGAVRSRVGLGKRKRAPTAHSLAVGRVMKQTGMGLAQASKYVKENGLAQ